MVLEITLLYFLDKNYELLSLSFQTYIIGKLVNTCLMTCVSIKQLSPALGCIRGIRLAAIALALHITIISEGNFISYNDMIRVM